MAKIKNDKYYTPDHIVEYCVNKTEEIIGRDNITEYLEPSAGSGVFLKYLNKPYKAYDIEPESNLVIKQDYLKLHLNYKKGRCIIGNPPFGIKNNLSVKFYKKAIKEGDFISFILPISQFDSTQSLYEFDLIYSEDLNKQMYSDREVHCCLNIYKINSKGYNKKPIHTLKDVFIADIHKGKNVSPNDYDISICSWGSVGKVCEHKDQYKQQIYITINNKKLKKQIIDLITKTDWKNYSSITASPRLPTWRIYKLLKEKIPGIK